MAIHLSTEDQKQVDIQVSIMLEQFEIEKQRTEIIAQQTAISNRAEAIRVAKDVLMENKRNLPISERELTPSEIVAFAETITNYVQG